VNRHLSNIEIEAYRSRSASPEQLLAINDHLFECDRCFRLFDSPDKVGRTYEAFKKIISPGAVRWHKHLDYDQLEGYVDGTLDADGRRFVLAHIEDCEECRSDIRDMAAIKERIKPQADSQPMPAKLDGPAALWQMPGYRLAFGLAVFIVVLACLFWAYAHRMQLRVGTQETTIARLEQVNNDLRRQTEEMTAKPPAGAALSLQDGNRQITMDKNGELLGLDVLPATYLSALKDALKTGRVPIPLPPETTMGCVGSLLGSGPRDKGFEVLSPTGIVVEDTRPVFEWQRLAGATEYIVMIKDLASGAEIESPSTSNTTWLPEMQLVRGHQYAWMVEANVEARRVRAPAPGRAFATFKVLDAQQALEISRARKMYGDSHLVMGLIYARAGLLHEAEKEFGVLLSANPDSSTAKSLLANVARKPVGGSRQ
jgi:hypothetical protein